MAHVVNEVLLYCCKNLDWGLPNSRSREAIIRQQGSDSRNRENRG
jgi:hypothetical protein